MSIVKCLNKLAGDMSLLKSLVTVQSRFYSTANKNGGNQNATSYASGSDTMNSKSNVKYQVAESMPPVPPNLGYPGDANTMFYFEKETINTSFRYGEPPMITRKETRGPMVIRMYPITHCSNRRFYRLAVTRKNCIETDPIIEDLGSIDPMPNSENQILVALNLERIKHYMSKSVPIRGKALPILGLSGFLPTHPSSYLAAYRNRRKQAAAARAQKQANEKAKQE